uniref:hypothetical protein n=1 Tax=Bacteroides acidifaciens TaxID=85831 RepID=UPI0025B0B3E3
LQYLIKDYPEKYMPLDFEAIKNSKDRFYSNQYVLPVNLSVLKNGQIKNAYWIYVRHPVHSPFYVLKNI